jgi:cytochrome c peroxidase
MVEVFMPGRHVAMACAALALFLMTVACSREPGSVAVDSGKLRIFGALPAAMEGRSSITEDKVTLGRMLYYDVRLSKSRAISCNSCHDLSKYGVDGEPTSDGHNGAKGERNSPTVYNAAGQFAQFWDGRAADVEEQVKGPALNPVEMAMPSEAAVVAVLKSIPEYPEAFKRAFPDDKDPVTFKNAANAIGAFERKLVTPSRWDKFLKGEQAALTNAEKAGFNQFFQTGCHSCHSGTLAGGKIFQKLGLLRDWPDTSDLGRYRVTRSAGDRMVFKVPSLRNVEKTGPYFHNGKVATLEQAVALMAEYQLGRTLADSEIKSIVTWLKSLTGEIPADYIKRPTS